MVPASRIAEIDGVHAAQRPSNGEADKALAEAKATGKPAAIASLTTEFSETSATPEGHLRLTQHPDQQRVKRAGAWVALDAALAANPDGSYSPKASATGVVLSKGGNGPLATLTSADGKKLALTAPFALPAPQVEGDSLTYPSVAADTDLKVTATKAGGMTTVLVLRTQAAADNPAIRSLHFATTVDGVAVSTDATGNLTAKTADGSVRWFAPTPQMWDSSTTTQVQQQASSGGTLQGRAVSAALMSGEATPSVPAADGAAGEKAGPVSTPAGPGEGARVVAMPVTADAKGVDLKPDQDLLAHGTAPYYIDPAWIPWAPSASSWTWVQSAYPTLSNWNRSGSDDSNFPGVGKCGYYAAGGSCSPVSTYRTFYQFDLSGLRGAVVNRAYMDLQEYVSADWSCTKTYPVDLYLTGAINSGTTWNNQPSPIGGSLGQSQVPGSGHGSCHDNVGFNYNITGAIQQYGTNTDTLTFGVYGDESNVNAFKRLTRQPSLWIEYDRVPNTPTNPRVLPEPVTVANGPNQACGVDDSNTWAWLGAGTDQNGATTLNATVSSPAQAQLWSWSHLWDYQLPGAPDVAGGYSPLVASGGNAPFSVPAGVIKDGHSYGFGIMATDQIVSWSASTPTCHFKADLTPPTVTFPDTVSDLNTQFPKSGNGQTPKIFAGKPGNIPFTATDPNPSGLNTSGLACLRWSWDPQLTGAAWQCGGALPTGQIPVTAGHWGTNILYVQAADMAGNRSPVAQYAFYAPWDPNGPAPRFGDVTGDSVPDILTYDGSGNLRAYTVPGNPNAAAPITTIAADPRHSPDATPSLTDPWDARYQITHRGGLRDGGNVDDVIVHKTNAPGLQAYKNPGSLAVAGALDVFTTLTKPACAVSTANPDCTGYAADWSATTSIAALGDPVSTTKQSPNRTGLLTVEKTPAGDGALWYYPAMNDNTFGSPIRLAATGWKDNDLIPVGDWAGQGHPGLWARDRGTGTVKAVTFTTGTASTDIVDPDFGDTTTVTYPAITAIATTATIKTGIAAASWDRVGSDGDLTGSGNPTLWGITSGGDIQIWNGHRTGTTDAPGYTFDNGPTTVLNTGAAADRWPLDKTTFDGTKATDTLGTNGATATGTVSWTTDHHKNTTDAATTLNGTSFKTAAPSVNTAGSYTVAAWVKPDNLTGYQTYVTQNGNERGAYYLQYSLAYGTWAFVSPGDDHANTGVYNHASAAGPARTDVWTHLVGTFDATTHTMTLYVNGQYSGTGTNTTPWNATGPTTIGIADTANYVPDSAASGAVSDVRTYPYALTAQQVNTLYTS
ncbi:LamG-like jellyroll fold domain-containing protein [Kitasatospora sp. NPDC048540]|uniref:LamG-like jellyroll fold domain-containing protein n=1 Tax=Kitasatospora sp. NPDC048540 TaxID=3155634 RepID=UPI0033FDBCAB